MKSITLFGLATIILFTSCSRKSNESGIQSLGACKWLVSGGMPASGYYHEIERQDDGKYLATLGSLTVILDKDGRQVSQGFQEIRKQKNQYTARLGTLEYTLDSDGIVIGVQVVH